MSIRKRGKKWFVEVRVKGKTSYKTFDTKIEAQRWEIDQKIVLNNSNEILRNKTFGQILERYFDEVSSLKKSEKFEGIKINKIKRSFLAKKAVYQIITEDINSYIDLNLHLKPESIRRELNLLSNIFTYCIKWKYCRINPVKGCNRPKPGKHRERRISDDEIAKILKNLNYADNKEIIMAKQALAVAFLLAIETGMRQGEIYKMKWDNVFLSEKYVLLKDTKNGDDRNVPLSTRADFLIKKMRGLSVKRVFPFNQQSSGAMFRRCLKQCGIYNLHFHDTRHEACSRLAKSLNVIMLAKVMGHKDTRMLMIYYNPHITEIANLLD